MYSIQSKLYIIYKVNRTLYTLHTTYNARRAVYVVQCSVYIVHCTSLYHWVHWRCVISTVHTTIHNAQCRLYSEYYTVYIVQHTLYLVYFCCTLFTVYTMIFNFYISQLIEYIVTLHRASYLITVPGTTCMIYRI